MVTPWCPCVARLWRCAKPAKYGVSSTLGHEHCILLERGDTYEKRRRKLSVILSKHAKNNRFYNDIYDFLGHVVKTISFYNEFDVSKHTCFIGVLDDVQSIDFLRWSVTIWPYKLTNHAKTTVFTMNYACLRTIAKLQRKYTYNLSKIYIDLSSATHKCHNLL